MNSFHVCSPLLSESFLAKEPEVTAPVVTPEPEPELAASLSEINLNSHKIGVIVAGRVGADDILRHIADALSKENIVGVVYNKIDDALILPYVVQKATKSCGIVIAATVLSNENVGSRALFSEITSALYNVGVTSSVPVIPAIVKSDSLLEAKGHLKEYAMSWAKAASALLSQEKNGSLNFQSMTFPAKPVTITSETLSVDVLINSFRESLKVSFFSFVSNYFFSLITFYHFLFGLVRNMVPVEFLGWHESFELPMMIIMEL